MQIVSTSPPPNNDHIIVYRINTLYVYQEHNNIYLENLRTYVRYIQTHMTCIQGPLSQSSINKCKAYLKTHSQLNRLLQVPKILKHLKEEPQ